MATTARSCSSARSLAIETTSSAAGVPGGAAKLTAWMGLPAWRSASTTSGQRRTLDKCDAGTSFERSRT